MSNVSRPGDRSLPASLRREHPLKLPSATPGQCCPSSPPSDSSSSWPLRSPCTPSLSPLPSSLTRLPRATSLASNHPHTPSPPVPPAGYRSKGVNPPHPRNPALAPLPPVHPRVYGYGFPRVRVRVRSPAPAGTPVVITTSEQAYDRISCQISGGIRSSLATIERRNATT